MKVPYTLPDNLVTGVLSSIPSVPGVVRNVTVERACCALRSIDVTDRKGGASPWVWFTTGVVATILVIGDLLMR